MEPKVYNKNNPNWNTEWVNIVPKHKLSEMDDIWITIGRSHQNNPFRRYFELFWHHIPQHVILTTKRMHKSPCCSKSTNKTVSIYPRTKNQKTATQKLKIPDLSALVAEEVGLGRVIGQEPSGGGAGHQHHKSHDEAHEAHAEQHLGASRGFAAHHSSRGRAGIFRTKSPAALSSDSGRSSSSSDSSAPLTPSLLPADSKESLFKAFCRRRCTKGGETNSHF